LYWDLGEKSLVYVPDLTLRSPDHHPGLEPVAPVGSHLRQIRSSRAADREVALYRDLGAKNLVRLFDRTIRSSDHHPGLKSVDPAGLLLHQVGGKRVAGQAAEPVVDPVLWEWVVEPVVDPVLWGWVAEPVVDLVFGQAVAVREFDSQVAIPPVRKDHRVSNPYPCPYCNQKYHNLGIRPDSHWPGKVKH